MGLGSRGFSTCFVHPHAAAKVCSLQDVTQAFRRLARKRHPDKGGSKEEFQGLRAVSWTSLQFCLSPFLPLWQVGQGRTTEGRFCLKSTEAYELLSTAGVLEDLGSTPAPCIETAEGNLMHA